MELIEEIEVMRKKIEEVQEQLNCMRKDLAEMEAKLPKEVEEDEIKPLSPEVLEASSKIFIREVHLEVDFKSRFINGVGWAKIHTLKELYLWISSEKPENIRNVGEKNIAEARALLQDIPSIIQKVEMRRAKIEKYDTPIEYLIDDEILIKRLVSDYQIKTLSQLYYEDVEGFKGIFPYDRKKEKQIIEILRRY